MLTKYCSQSREMASNASSSRLTRPRKSDVSSRRRPFAEFSSVAGANAPAFVERTSAIRRLTKSSTVSPELTLRPSLSDRAARQGGGLHSRVAGANAPAFVERGCLVARPHSPACVAGANAPAFVERASGDRESPQRRCVAGANVPAFVERSREARSRTGCCRVAGANAPAFVERTAVHHVLAAE